MGLHKGFEDSQLVSDLNYDEDLEGLDPIEDSEHKKRVRKMIEERLERKRLKEELEDELDGEFDWDEIDK
ncbi:PA3496 family putative envelope integrity protein [Legionella impletisoli]|uniref:Uncharacterized protein n=1 Tax=Legionella impletisoli TaxID=343510 RepID=A0A917JRU9_9GAMM|nr:hypothetical protein [Legionella impletisoli]GGI80675.1 hypothetical protein GCM10007966_06490 [Legionella impletisoli]